MDPVKPLFFSSVTSFSVRRLCCLSQYVAVFVDSQPGNRGRRGHKGDKGNPGAPGLDGRDPLPDCTRLVCP